MAYHTNQVKRVSLRTAFAVAVASVLTFSGSASDASQRPDVKPQHGICAGGKCGNGSNGNRFQNRFGRQFGKGKKPQDVPELSAASLGSASILILGGLVLAGTRRRRAAAA